MRVLLLIFCLAIFSNTIGQVPAPPVVNKPTNTTPVSGTLKWKKVAIANYEFTNENGTKLTNVQKLSRLNSDSIPYLDKTSRKVYLLPDAHNTAVGATGNVVKIHDNLPKDFVISNRYRVASYVNDNYESGDFVRVKSDYIKYVPALNATYTLNNAYRTTTDWHIGTVTKLEPTYDNSYWLKTEGTKYIFIKEGNTLDYSTVTTKSSGDDLIVDINNIPTYILKGFYTIASYTIKPALKYDASLINTKPSVGNSGCVKGDCKDGWGKYNYENGYYDGFWTNGKKNGYGAYIWDGSGRYVGNWENDTMKGYGVYYGDDKKTYQYGEWENGKLNGLGYTYTNEKWKRGIYKNGEISQEFELFKNNKETGCVSGDCQNKFGYMVWDNGDNFIGFFKDGRLYMGEYTFANGDVYKGYFNSQNEFDNMGVFSFVDKSIYNGRWSNGQYNGKGYYHNKDGVQQIGIWKDGTLVTPMK